MAAKILIGNKKEHVRQHITEIKTLLLQINRNSLTSAAKKVITHIHEF